MGKKKDLAQKLAKAIEKLANAQKEVQALTKLVTSNSPNTSCIIRYESSSSDEIFFVTKEAEQDFLHEYFQDNGGKGERYLENYYREVGLLFSVESRLQTSNEYGVPKSE